MTIFLVKGKRNSQNRKIVWEMFANFYLKILKGHKSMLHKNLYRDNCFKMKYPIIQICKIILCAISAIHSSHQMCTLRVPCCK